MKFTFVSNYINHHQLPMARKMYEELGDDYAFIETEPITEERLKLGWGESDQIPFLHRYYEEKEICEKLIMDSDIVMFGGVDDESFLINRLQAKKPVIRYAERFYKDGRYKAVSPRGLMKKYKDHTKYRNAPVYLLCAGAYVAGDYQIVQSYPKKKFTWGYFPEKKEYDLSKLLAGKKSEDCLHILWAGRMIHWKHPEMVIELAKELQKDSSLPDWEITMIGGGALEDEIKKNAKKAQLSDKITFPGTMKPGQVREYMEKADIYLFTSDYQEGWGAVMNEAMNSAACVVANVGIGASYSLIETGKNGILYPNGDFTAYVSAVKKLMQDDELRMDMAKSAYETIHTTWNPENAARLLLDFSKAICKEYAQKGPKGRYRTPIYMELPESGPMSKASLR